MAKEREAKAKAEEDRRLKELEEKISSHQEDDFKVKMHQVSGQTLFRSLLDGSI